MLSLILVVTLIMGIFGIPRVELTHKFQTMLPKTDTINKIHQDMIARFGEDGMVMVIGLNDKELFTLEKFQQWKKMGDEIKSVDGVDSVFSVAHMYGLYKNDSLKKFELRGLSPTMPQTQAEVDSIKEVVHSFPFYDGLLYNDETGASLMMVFINSEKFNSKNRGSTLPDVVKVSEKYQQFFPPLRYSGMPYIRDVIFNIVRYEMRLFVILSAIATILIIFVFFRSFRLVFACMGVVAIGVVWAFGTMGFLGFMVSPLMALTPPLMIVIAIPNCIYLITRYHVEFVRSGNKVRSLDRVIQRIGGATFMTNATTSIGFATFILTNNEKLVEFGIVACINVMALFFLSLIFIPTILSFMKDPSVKHTKHLSKKWVEKTVGYLEFLALKKRTTVYIVTIILAGLSFIGVSKMRVTGAITEDLPWSHQVKKDLFFIEDNFGGMVPFEIIINFKLKGQIQREKNLQKIDAIQQLLHQDTVFSKSLSIVDATKFVNQAFYGGDPDKYKIIEKRDLAFIKPYLESIKGKNSTGGVKGFIDSTETRARITTQVKDLGSKDLDKIEFRIAQKADSILNPDKKEMNLALEKIYKANGASKDTLLSEFYENFPRVYNILLDEIAGNDTAKLITLEEDPAAIYAWHQDKNFNKHLKSAADKNVFTIAFTGSAVAFATGTKYLVGNLATSLIYAILSISILMAFIFRSFRMVIISMVPNLIPLLFTAAIMGFLDVPLKPSTLLVFSIALGISVDDAIHFLAKYRQELKTGSTIQLSALKSIRESGVSMIYTSIVLFCGFLMFTFSDFGGTKALGMLISLTLLVAMVCNLIILPSLLVTLDKWVNTKALKEPFIEIFDEEIDEDLSGIQVETNKNNS